jgi:hypothetical protein
MRAACSDALPRCQLAVTALSWTSSSAEATPAPGNAPPIHTHAATDADAIALERGARSSTVSTKALACSTAGKNNSFVRHSSFVVMESPARA